jgi:hypothetical protein
MNGELCSKCSDNARIQRFLLELFLIPLFEIEIYIGSRYFEISDISRIPFPASAMGQNSTIFIFYSPVPSWACTVSFYNSLFLLSDMSEKTSMIKRTCELIFPTPTLNV